MKKQKQNKQTKTHKGRQHFSESFYSHSILPGLIPANCGLTTHRITQSVLYAYQVQDIALEG